MTPPLPPAVVDVVRRMNGTRRFVGLGLIAGALALLWVATRWASGPTYVTLFRELELNTVGAVTDGLTKAGIAYRLTSGGTEILVPESEVARARVVLAKDGLPANGRPGLELFDKPAWGMTDFTQRITYRRALEGELSRTIGTLRGVERAQVHLALPESSPLRRLERPAQAAVVVTLRPGTTLTPDVVQGIASIVSNSVERLPMENVAVMDDSGRLLSNTGDAGGVYGLTTRQLELQRSVERQLADKVDGLLATVLGPGRARVQVAARLNFEQVEKTIESYDPDGQVIQTEQRSETVDETTGAGSQTIVSNAYQNSKKLERVIGSVGNIDRLTVAVLVDERALGDSAVAASEATLAGLDAAVRNAIGLDSARGDRLTITALPFGPPAAVALGPIPADSVPAADVTVIVERFSRPALLLVGIVVILVLGLRFLKPVGVPAATPAGTLPGSAPSAATLAAAGAAAPEIPASPSLQLRARVQAESADSPGTAAQVMRAWLAESQ